MKRRKFFGLGLAGIIEYVVSGNAFCGDGLEMRAFSANYSKTDLDGNGTLEGKELEGEGKKKFGIDEKVSFGVNVFDGYRGEKIKFRLVRGNDILFEKDYEIKRKKDFAIYTYEPGQLKEGKYKGIWSMEGKKDVKCEVEVKN